MDKPWFQVLPLTSHDTLAKPVHLFPASISTFLKDTPHYTVWFRELNEMKEEIWHVKHALIQQGYIPEPGTPVLNDQTW